MILYLLLFFMVLIISVPIKNNYIQGTKGYALTKVALFSVFILLFAVSACRIAVGNDYWPYVANFDLIRQSRKVSSEIGFNILVQGVQSLFHFTKYYVIIFAIISFFTCLCFVKGIFEQSEWFMYSLFLLLANGFYYSSLNSVRYYLALSIALVSIKFLLDGRNYEFLATVILGALMHKSILIVIPIYYLAKVNWKRWTLIIPAGMAAALFFFKDIIREIVFKFYKFYENSSFDTNDVSIVNIAKTVAVLIFSLIYYKKAIATDNKNKFYFNLNIAALIIFGICYYIPESTRIGYYCSITNILLIPGIIKKIDNKKERMFWITVISIAYLLYFAFYLKTCYQTNIRILPYRNWIFD